MAIVWWAVLGAIAGFIAAKVMKHRGRDLLLDVGVAVTGAIVGGFVSGLLGGAGATALDATGAMMAAGAAVFAVAIYQSLTERMA